MDNLGRSVEAGKVANKGGWNCFQIVTKPGEGNFYKTTKASSIKSHLAFIWK